MKRFLVGTAVVALLAGTAPGLAAPAAQSKAGPAATRVRVFEGPG